MGAYYRRNVDDNLEEFARPQQDAVWADSPPYTLDERKDRRKARIKTKFLDITESPYGSVVEYPSNSGKFHQVDALRRNGLGLLLQEIGLGAAIPDHKRDINNAPQQWNLQHYQGFALNVGTWYRNQLGEAQRLNDQTDSINDYVNVIMSVEDLDSPIVWGV